MYSRRFACFRRHSPGTGEWHVGIIERQLHQARLQQQQHIIRRHGPDSVAFYVSGQLLTEDYYVFNKLAKGLVGTNNIDTNSRLCMSSAV